MREILNFLNFGKERKEKEKRKEKRNIEVSKIKNFGNLKINICMWYKIN